MPSGVHYLEVDVPIRYIWNFVRDMDNWAPLVPGYTEHEILNDRQSTWKFKGDLGIIQKTVSLKIDITEWLEPVKVTFDLKGLNENFVGNGFFEAETLTKTNTKMTGYLKITAKGMKGPMINAVLKSFVPRITKDLTEAIAAKIRERETVTNY